MERTAPESPASRNFKLLVMRLLIAAYLMACSVGIAPGPNLVPTLSRLIPETYALALGTAMMFLPAYTMMAGIWLRGSIHILAMMIALNTILELFVFNAVPKPGVLLQEIVTLCAMLQCLMLLKGRHFRHESIVKKKVPVRRLDPSVSAPSNTASLSTKPVKIDTSFLPEPRLRTPGVAFGHSARQQNRAPEKDADVVNIFAT